MKLSACFISLLPILSTLFLVPSVDAHGYVSFFAVDGTAYAGNSPGGKSNPSPIRQISTIDPVKGTSNPFMSCGQNAQNAALVVDAMPGSKITFQWSDGAGNWPHNTGPLMTYMASCGSTTCDKFDSSNAQWFKIDEAGKKANDASTWVQQDIMNGMSYTTMVPSTLASGQYLVRHEIIALHLATSVGGAEFYPSCTQINVGGDQTSVPSSSELVSFPGAYSDTDPGIYDPNVFDSGATYTFPGPPIASMAAGDSSSDSTGSPITAASPGSSSPNSSSGPHSSSSGSYSYSPSASIPASSGSPKPSKSSSSVVPSSTNSVYNVNAKSCSLKRNQDDATVIYPRHLSRVMRRLAHGRSW